MITDDEIRSIYEQLADQGAEAPITPDPVEFARLVLADDESAEVGRLTGELLFERTRLDDLRRVIGMPPGGDPLLYGAALLDAKNQLVADLAAANAVIAQRRVDRRVRTYYLVKAPGPALGTPTFHSLSESDSTARRRAATVEDAEIVLVDVARLDGELHVPISAVRIEEPTKEDIVADRKRKRRAELLARAAFTAAEIKEIDEGAK